MFSKKELIKQKLKEGGLILRNRILCAAHSMFYTAPGTLSVIFLPARPASQTHDSHKRTHNFKPCESRRTH